jgi:hypothetical protein
MNAEANKMISALHACTFLLKRSIYCDRGYLLNELSLCVRHNLRSAALFYAWL